MGGLHPQVLAVVHDPVPPDGDVHDREQVRGPKPSGVPSILVATPVMNSKLNSAKFLANYWACIRNLTFPHAAISVAILDDDISRNGSTWRR